MKIPRHILNSFSNNIYSFQDSNFNKITFDSFHLNIPFTNQITNDKGSILVTKTKNKIYIYIEYNHKIDEHLKNVLNAIENYIINQPAILKKIKKQKLTVHTYEKTVDFNKLKKRRSLSKIFYNLGILVFLFVSFFLVTFYSLKVNNTISSLHFYITGLLFILCFYLIYRMSNARYAESFKNSSRFFVIIATATSLSLLSFFVIK